MYCPTTPPPTKKKSCQKQVNNEIRHHVFPWNFVFSGAAIYRRIIFSRIWNNIHKLTLYWKKGASEVLQTIPDAPFSSIRLSYLVLFYMFIAELSIWQIVLYEESQWNRNLNVRSFMCSVFPRATFADFTSLRKHTYSNIWKILQPKKGKKSDKKYWYFSYFCSKHRLWVLVRTASTRRF